MLCVMRKRSDELLLPFFLFFLFDCVTKQLEPNSVPTASASGGLVVQEILAKNLIVLKFIEPTSSSWLSEPTNHSHR
ncbi:hypothetical protein CH063_03621 [Colletotrichum higginsianum]|uniref:Secreted protein n=1 Tax=Colletotrichum higginsianum (strain IMI 349063) TaxID=759273 RepID=H1VZ37_COLHI|nr:hypothetical protein CH063_03621 [Colletotrichum higginsianum]